MEEAKRIYVLTEFGEVTIDLSNIVEHKPNLAERMASSLEFRDAVDSLSDKFGFGNFEIGVC